MATQDEPEQTSARADLAARVEALVSSTFAERRQVVLLSYLGQALRKAGFDFREILGEQKLADFIKNELSDKVQIVPTPAGPLILAAAPANVDLAAEIDPFGTAGRIRSEKPDSSDREKRDLLKRGVWFAFSHKLESGKARVLRLEPEFEYEDYDVGDKRPDGVDVPNELIVPVGSVPRDERNEIIYQNIRAWAEQNGVAFRRLTESHHADQPVRRSALDVLLAVLSDSDLSRISMPLDVVAKLRRKQQ